MFSFNTALSVALGRAVCITPGPHLRHVCMTVLECLFFHFGNRVNRLEQPNSLHEMCSSLLTAATHHLFSASHLFFKCDMHSSQ